MEQKKPLSQYGVGPFYAVTVLLLTVIALLLDHAELMPVLRYQPAAIILKFLAAGCLLAAAILWINSVIVMNIRKRIRENQLLTSGAYAWVRNPIYSAIMLLMWGVLLWNGNLLLLLLCPVYHVLMTVMVKYTEEKWLTELYGQAYLDYCRMVWRCIPRPPKKGK